MEVKLEEVIQANSDILNQIYGLIDRVTRSEMTFNKERAGFLVRLRNELGDILTNNYGQLLEDSKSMTDYATAVGLSKETPSMSR